MEQSDLFIKPGKGDWVDVAPGVRRRLLGFNSNLMLVEVGFEEDAVGERHSHPHAQSSYVASGRFEVTIGEKTEILGTGDGYFVPPSVEHGCQALEAGVLIDAFAPRRDEFVA